VGINRQDAKRAKVFFDFQRDESKDGAQEQLDSLPGVRPKISSNLGVLGVLAVGLRSGCDNAATIGLACD